MTAASRGLYARSRGSKPVRQFVSDYEVPAGVTPPPEPAYFLDLYGACQRRPALPILTKKGAGDDRAP